MTNKKGMGVGEVFVYIVAALTFALIMIFGYKAINDFLVSGEEVEFVQFKNSLESSISKIYTEYGAVRIQNFYVPGKYDQVCFVDFNVLYTDDAGRLVASWVDVIVPEQPAATGGQTAPVSSQPAEPAVPEEE